MKIVGVALIVSITVSSVYPQELVDSTVTGVKRDNTSLFEESLKKKKRERNVIRVALGVLSVSGFVIGYINGDNARERGEQYQEMTTGTQQEFDDAWNSVQRAQKIESISYGVAGVSLLGISLTFLF